MRVNIKTIRLILISVLFLFAFSLSVSAAEPSKVQNLKVTTSKTTAKLTWSKATNASYYRVYLVDNTTEAFVKVIKKTTRNYLTLKNLSEGTTYTFKVRAYGSKDEKGVISDKAVAKIGITKPDAPKNFRVSSYGDGSVILRWSKVKYNLTGYTLFLYDETAKEYKEYRNIAKSATVTTVKKLKVNTTYKFILKAYKQVNGQKVYGKSSDEVKASIIEMTAEAKKIHKPYFSVKTRSSVTATKKDGSGTVVLKAGTKLTVTSRSGSVVNGFLSDGTAITIKRSNLKYINISVTTKNDYSTATKENFVNAKGLTSRTKYLIWINEAKLRVNIFKGSTRNWKLVKSYTCVTGKMTTRTVHGIHRILAKRAYAAYGSHVIYFSSGKGTASNPAGCAFHHYVDGHHTGALSHGCVRMSKSALNFMYSNCGVGTTVYIY